MAWSFPIGRILGIELRVHATFFLLIAWIALTGWQAGGAAQAGLYTLYIALLFACVVLHEFGHALMARRFGIRTPDVTLLPIGGLARLEKMPDKPAQEIAVALAGPAVNLVIFAALGLVFGLPASPAEIASLTLADLPGQIALLNLILAVFNLLPAFPMDGGRVLRALLAMRLPRVRATELAALAGRGFAFALGLAGLMAANPMLILIAFFVFVAAGAESADETLRSLARDLLARDAMITEFESLAPADSLDAAATALIRTTQTEFPVLDPTSGAPLGFLTRDALYGGLAASPRPANVAALMSRDIPVARLADRLDTVLKQMQGRAPAVAILGPTGALIGYVTRENLGELMVVAQARANR